MINLSPPRSPQSINQNTSKVIAGQEELTPNITIISDKHDYEGDGPNDIKQSILGISEAQDWSILNPHSASTSYYRSTNDPRQKMLQAHLYKTLGIKDP